MPSGNGGFSGVPNTACVSGTAKAGSPRPGNASAALTAWVLSAFSIIISFPIELIRLPLFRREKRYAPGLTRL
jgi:hypothetical protein